MKWLQKCEIYVTQISQLLVILSSEKMPWSVIKHRIMPMDHDVMQIVVCRKIDSITGEKYGYAE